MPVKPLPPPESRPRHQAEIALSSALMRLEAAHTAAANELQPDTIDNAAALADLVHRAVTDAQIAIASYRRAAGGR